MLAFSCARIDYVDLTQVRQRIATVSGSQTCAEFGLTVSAGTVLIWLQTVRPLQVLAAWLNTSGSCTQTATTTCATAIASAVGATQLRINCPSSQAGQAVLVLKTESSVSLPLTTVVRWAPRNQTGGSSVAMLAIPVGPSLPDEQADLAMTSSGTRLLFEAELR